MLSRLRNMFVVTDLRNKILFTLAMIAVYRFGAFVPLPYVDYQAIVEFRSQAEENLSGIAAYINLFSGGLSNAAVFSLGIMPYITASIIMQLLGVVIPKLEEWRQEGQTGQKKITQWTRYVTIGLAVVQSTALVVALEQGNQAFLGGAVPNQNLIPNANPARFALIVLVLTAGTALVMWFGELITQRGIGNGMSILIFASVASGIPAIGIQIYESEPMFVFLVILAIAIAMIAGIVFIESGQRRIPVQFAKRVVGRRQMGGQSTYIPLKVNTSGVIPVIFASSLLQFPSIIAQATPQSWGVQQWVSDNLLSGTSWIYIISFSLLILFFAYFYTAIAFNPEQQADIIKKQGGFIPGIRPGRPTEEYLRTVLNRITLPGALFLMVVALTPLLAFKFFDIPGVAQFGGTSLLILVGVGLETMKQIDSQLMNRNYEGFLAS